ncbi:hypothetical protein SAMN04489713_107122 [Actinomadura madurae]|uniref:Resolvase, N terminal domain n=1 Tax=Actinomadura madurae TaxID=1993 RepID=A0A1I5I4H6_9ACTN|nr:hypothetical protein [Actinomadura madurae]SFO55472.1 hypothetical protein SAMN04489713_107122 [Actinomadura madurae]
MSAHIDGTPYPGGARFSEEPITITSRPGRGTTQAASLVDPFDGLRVAWCGRTSTDDMRDPTLSLPRQLDNSRQALPAGALMVAHFYGIESGRKNLEDRGRGTAHTRFHIPIPRDGGIQDLLAEATRPDRRFDAVVCESIDRISRRTFTAPRSNTSWNKPAFRCSLPTSPSP